MGRELCERRGERVRCARRYVAISDARVPHDAGCPFYAAYLVAVGVESLADAVKAAANMTVSGKPPRRKFKKSSGSTAGKGA